MTPKCFVATIAKMKVLIIEDDADLAKEYQEKISLKGFAVRVASDGEAGLTQIKQWHPDLVLIDIIMPKKNGLDVLKEIKSDDELKDIIAVITTNFGQENLVKEAFEHGANDFIVKYQTTSTEVAEKIASMASQKN